MVSHIHHPAYTPPGLYTRSRSFPRQGASLFPLPIAALRRMSVASKPRSIVVASYAAKSTGACFFPPPPPAPPCTPFFPLWLTPIRKRYAGGSKGAKNLFPPLRVLLLPASRSQLKISFSEMLLPVLFAGALLLLLSFLKNLLVLLYSAKAAQPNILLQLSFLKARQGTNDPKRSFIPFFYYGRKVAVSSRARQVLRTLDNTTIFYQNGI